MSRIRMVYVLSTVFLLFPLLAAHGEAQTEKPVRIGLITEQTGVAAPSGERGIRATKLAEKQLNAAGGVNGSRIQVITYDNNSSHSRDGKCRQ